MSSPTTFIQDGGKETSSRDYDKGNHVKKMIALQRVLEYVYIQPVSLLTGRGEEHKKSSFVFDILPISTADDHKETEDDHRRTKNYDIDKHTITSGDFNVHSPHIEKRQGNFATAEAIHCLKHWLGEDKVRQIMTLIEECIEHGVFIVEDTAKIILDTMCEHNTKIFHVYREILHVYINNIQVTHGLDLDIYAIAAAVFFRCAAGQKADWLTNPIAEVIYCLIKETCLCFIKGNVTDYFVVEKNIIGEISYKSGKQIVEHLLQFLRTPEQCMSTILQGHYKIALPNINACEEEKLYHMIILGFEKYEEACRTDTKEMHNRLTAVANFWTAVTAPDTTILIHDEIRHRLKAAIHLINVALKWLKKIEIEAKPTISSLKLLCSTRLQTLIPRITHSNFLAKEVNRLGVIMKLLSMKFVEETANRDGSKIGKVFQGVTRDENAMRQVECHFLASVAEAVLGNFHKAEDHIRQIPPLMIDMVILDVKASKILCEEAKIQLYLSKTNAAVENLTSALELDGLNADAILYFVYASEVYVKDTISENSTIHKWLRNGQFEDIHTSYKNNLLAAAQTHLVRYVNKIPEINNTAKMYVFFFTMYDLKFMSQFPDLVAEIQFLMKYKEDRQCQISRIPVPSRVVLPYMLLCIYHHDAQNIPIQKCRNILHDAGNVSSDRCLYIANALNGHILFRQSLYDRAFNSYEKAFRSFNSNVSNLVKKRSRMIQQACIEHSSCRDR